MHAEVLLLILFAALACLPIGWQLGRRPFALLGLALLSVGGGALQYWAFQSGAAGRRESFAEMAAELPHLERPGVYVSSDRCQACHPAEYESWHRSYHRTMTQVARPENVLGKFDGTEVLSEGLRYRVYRKGDQLWAEMPDPELMMYIVEGTSMGISKQIDSTTYLVRKSKKGKIRKVDLRTIPRVQRRVVMATGSHHYQTYWVPGNKKFGRLLQTLPLVYLPDQQQWIPREAAFMFAPGAPRMITQWNHHCINCHSTGGLPGLVGKGPNAWFDTAVGELGIACEACHGPGARHVRLNRDPLRRYRLHLTGAADSSIVNPRRLDHRKSSQVCGQCHGVFVRTGHNGMAYARRGVLYRPGEDLHKTRYYIQYPLEGSDEEREEDLRRNPDFFRERWWEDGTILAGGREYTAISVSACYTKGTISCLSCHSLHESDPDDQLKANMRTNRACTQCHDTWQYTSRIESHTFHAADSTGSSCLNCHMPHTTYALFKAIRTHQIQSPNIRSSVRYGVPNACNLCHLDKTLAWTQKHMIDWYGHAEEPLTEQQRTYSAAVLWLLKGHAAQRVIAAWHVGWEPAQQASGAHWLAPIVAPLLADPYGVVRYVAARSLRTLPGFRDFDYNFLAGVPALDERVKAALRQWSGVPPEFRTERGSAMLIDPAGHLIERDLAALLRERDNRPVTIKE